MGYYAHPDVHRAAELKWRNAPPGLAPKLAGNFMVGLLGGKTIKDMTCNGQDHICSLGRFNKHCELNPEWGRKVRKLSWENFAKKSRASSHWRRRTETTCLKGLHPMRGANLLVDPSNGKRRCRACHDAVRAGRPLDPCVIDKVKKALLEGASIGQVCWGKPVGGGKIDRSLFIVNPAKFYRLRKLDETFDRLVVEAKSDSNFVGQKIRQARDRSRRRTAAARTEINDYHVIRSLLPASFRDKDDVVSAIFEDLLTGTIKREDVRARVQTYIAAHNRMFPTKYAKFGNNPLVSLDEVMFEDGSTTRGDTVSRGLWD